MPEPIQTPVPAADELAAQVLLLAQSRLTADLRFLSSALEQLKPIPVPALDTLFAGAPLIPGTAVCAHTRPAACHPALSSGASLSTAGNGSPPMEPCLRHCRRGSHPGTGDSLLRPAG